MNGNFDAQSFDGSVGGFDTDGGTVVVFDTHDGFDERKKKRIEEYRAYHDKLREDVRRALEGPKAEEIRKELEPYAKPTESKPFWETVDIEGIAGRIAGFVALRMEIARIEHERQYQAMLEDDDDDVLLLI